MDMQVISLNWPTIWQGTIAITVVVGLLGTAIWRFVRVETSLKHNSKCQVKIVKAVLILSNRHRRLQRDLRRHITEEDAKLNILLRAHGFDSQGKPIPEDQKSTGGELQTWDR